MTCLQAYREKLSLMTFPRAHSNSKEVSYLPWQNIYPNLKTTCHIKPRFFLWTKLPNNLLLAKFLISVIAALSLNELDEKSRTTIFLGNFVNKLQPSSYCFIIFRKNFSLVKIKEKNDELLKIRNTFLLVLDVDVEESIFFQCRIKYSL